MSGNAMHNAISKPSALLLFLNCICTVATVVILFLFLFNRVCTDSGVNRFLFVSEHILMCTTHSQHWINVLLSSCLLVCTLSLHFYYNSLRNVMGAGVKTIDDLFFFLFVLGWTIVVIHKVRDDSYGNSNGLVFSLQGMDTHRFGVVLMSFSILVLAVAIWCYVFSVLQEDAAQTIRLFTVQKMRIVLSFIFVLSCYAVFIYSIVIIFSYAANSTSSADFKTVTLTSAYAERAAVVEHIFLLLGVLYLLVASFECYEMIDKCSTNEIGWCLQDTVLYCRWQSSNNLVSKSWVIDQVFSVLLLLFICAIFLIIPVA